jgi:hypothetical protein
MSRFYDAIEAGVPADREDAVYYAFESFEVPWGDLGSYDMHSTRSAIRAQFVLSWTEAFALQKNQEPVVAAIVDDYMARYETMVSGLRARIASGQATQRDLRRAEIALTEEMQKRVAAELDLDEKQAERVKNWGTIYRFEVRR